MTKLFPPYIISYLILIFLTLTTFIIFRPFQYIDNAQSYITCTKDNSRFEIGPNLIYTFTNQLDEFNDKKARKLCEHKMTRDYADSLKTPEVKNYTFHPVYREESSWLNALLASTVIFLIGSVAIESLIKPGYIGKMLLQFLLNLGPAVEILFFTNFWIFLYVTIISNLRLIFPPKPNDDFLILGVYPEPFEIPLYLFFILIALLFIYFFHIRAKRVELKLQPAIKYAVIFFLVLLFINNLGEYPLKGEQPQQPNSLVFFIVYILTATTFFIELAILQNFLKQTKFKNIVFYIIIIAFIALVTFPPRFAISGVDYSYFFGPILEVAQRKTIYSEVSSQYGFLSILFFTILYKLGLSLTYIPVFVWILLIIQYFLCFYLVSKQSRSFVFGLIGLFSLLTVNFFTVRVIPTDFPQAGPLRWLPLIGSLFLFQKLKNFTSYKLILFIALASFWMIDSGIELLLTYCFSLFLLFLTKQLDAKKTIKTLGLLFASLLTVFTLVQLFHLILGYKAINFFAAFTKLQQYAKAGFGMLPIEAKTYFWIAMLFYFASLIYFFRNALSPSNVSHLTSNILILFSANLMLFTSIYYIGRSHQAELYTISLFIILNALLFLGTLYQNLRTTKAKIFFASIIFLLFVFIPAFNRKEILTRSLNLRFTRLLTGNIFYPEMNELLQKKYAREVRMITRAIPQKEALIISGDDTYLFYLTGKTSLLSDNSLVNILTKQDLKVSLKKTLAACPQRIIGECRLFQSCPQTELFSKAFYAWQPIILNEVQSGCKLKYKPLKCTNQLCIAEISK